MDVDDLGESSDGGEKLIEETGRGVRKLEGCDARMAAGQIFHNALDRKASFAFDYVKAAMTIIVILVESKTEARLVINISSRNVN
jgi:hypothetical protein